MKTLACRFKTTYSNIFGQIFDLIEVIHENMEKRLTNVKNQVKKATGAAKAEAQRMRDKIQKDVDRMKV